MSGRPSCLVCQATGNLCRCEGCTLVYYCGPEHQRSDRARHEKVCDDMGSRLDVDQYRKKHLTLPSVDAATSAGLNKTDEEAALMAADMSVSAAWILVRGLTLNFDHKGATEEVVRLLLERELLVDLLEEPKRRRGEVIPGHYIRLGQDHDAYSYIKWTNLGRPIEPLGVHDMFESPDGWGQSDSVDIRQVPALALIKVRLLIDLQAMQNAARAFEGGVAGRLPREIFDLIRRNLTHSSLLEVRAHLLSASKDEVFALIQTLKGHIRTLVRRMLSNGEYKVGFPGGCQLWLTEEHACFMAKSSHLAWEESPGAIDVAAAVAESFKGDVELPVQEESSTGLLNAGVVGE